MAAGVDKPVVRIGAGAEAGTAQSIAEGLRQMADDVEAGEITLIAVAFVGPDTNGEWIATVGTGTVQPVALLGTISLMRARLEQLLL